MHDGYGCFVAAAGQLQSCYTVTEGSATLRGRKPVGRSAGLRPQAGSQPILLPGQKPATRRHPQLPAGPGSRSLRQQHPLHSPYRRPGIVLKAWTPFNPTLSILATAPCPQRADPFILRTLGSPRLPHLLRFPAGEHLVCTGAPPPFLSLISSPHHPHALPPTPRLSPIYFRILKDLLFLE